MLVVLVLVGCTTVEAPRSESPSTSLVVTATPLATAAPTTVAPPTAAPTTATPATASPIVSSDPSDDSISAAEWELILQLSNADPRTPVDRVVPFVEVFCGLVEQFGLQEAMRRTEAAFDEGSVPQEGRDLTYNGASYYCLDAMTSNP